MNKFNVGDVVLYQNGERFELGVIKSVLFQSKKDAVLIDLASITPDVNLENTYLYNEEGKYKYRVWYHTGDTTALTDEDLLHPIANAYAFSILRRSANNEIQLSPCRQFAAKLLNQSDYINEDYYAIEDWLTYCLENLKVIDRPMWQGHFYYFLFNEIKTRLESIHNIEDPDDKDVQEIVNRMFDSDSEIYINYNVFDDFIKDYLKEKRNK